MKKLAVVSALVASVAGQAAFAQGGFYGSMMLGSAFFEDAPVTQDVEDTDYTRGTLTVENGSAASAAIGYRFENFLLEAEYSQIGGNAEELQFPRATSPYDRADVFGTIDVQTYMLNGWFVLGEGAFRPFLGAGIGYATGEMYAWHTFETSIDDQDTSFAWQLGAGFEYDINDHVSLVGAYKYVAADAFELVDSDDTNIDADFEAGTLQFGLRVGF